MVMDRIAMIIAIIGALNWGSVGLFKFDIVAWICGGQTSLAARIIYTVVALAGLWCISLLFRSRDDEIEETSVHKSILGCLSARQPKMLLCAFSSRTRCLFR